MFGSFLHLVMFLALSSPPATSFTASLVQEKPPYSHIGSVVLWTSFVWFQQASPWNSLCILWLWIIGSLPTYQLNKVGGCTRAQLQAIAIFLKAQRLPNGAHTLTAFPADTAATQPSAEKHCKCSTAAGVRQEFITGNEGHVRQLKW